MGDAYSQIEEHTLAIQCSQRYLEIVRKINNPKSQNFALAILAQAYTIAAKIDQSKVRFCEHLRCLADKGYQGIAKIHANSITPQKKPPRKPLGDDDKQANRVLARLRVKVEPGIRRLKRFRILSERYRNRRRHFTRRLHRLAGIINFEIALVS